MLIRIPHRIPFDLKHLEELHARGVTPPPRPFVGGPDFFAEHGSPTADDQKLDAELQQQLDLWVSQIDALHKAHFGRKEGIARPRQICLTPKALSSET